MPPHPDAIADCVLTAFKALPPKCKPRVYPNGTREWVPLAGIVLGREKSRALNSIGRTREYPHLEKDGDYQPRALSATSPLVCISLATGMKCLPQSKLTMARGNILHDWHAEVLALRGFNRWLIDECARTLKNEINDKECWLECRPQDSPHQAHGKTTFQSFSLADDVQIHMYCSEAPCGDASMELTMADQADPTPWSEQEQELPTISDETVIEEMLGRGHFDRLGIVRRKPARPDAPVSLSKSCTDKLAMKQCTGLTNSITSLLVKPMYLSTLVLPEDRYVAQAVERAWSINGRMKGLSAVNRMETPYAYHPFRVETTSHTFDFAKDVNTRASNLSVLALPEKTEVLVNGVLQGRKQSDPRGGCSVSRRQMWAALKEVVLAQGLTIPIGSYQSLKQCDMLEHRRRIKADAQEHALQPWIPNLGDENWMLE